MIDPSKNRPRRVVEGSTPFSDVSKSTNGRRKPITGGGKKYQYFTSIQNTMCLYPI
jgi:hypothetical protein